MVEVAVVLVETLGPLHYIQEQVVLVVEEVEKGLECKTRVVLDLITAKTQAPKMH
jgi:hypothetical protein